MFLALAQLKRLLLLSGLGGPLFFHALEPPVFSQALEGGTVGVLVCVSFTGLNPSNYQVALWRLVTCRTHQSSIRLH